MPKDRSFRSSLEAIASHLNEFSPWLLAGAVAVLSGLAANIVWGTIEVWREQFPGRLIWGNLLLLLVYGFSLYMLFRRRNVFFRPRTRYLKDQSKVKSRKNLILFLSHLNRLDPPHEYRGGVPSWLSLSEENRVELDFKEMERIKDEDSQKKWNWQMPLQAICHHRSALERVVLICSNAPTSIGAVHHFVDICKRYEALRHIKFQIYRRSSPHVSNVTGKTLDLAEGVDFNSFDQLSRAVWRILKRLQRRKVKEGDVVIDFTGGMKVTSVVAAATTFNRRIEAQYVNMHTMQVIGYDVVFSSSALDEQEIM